ncbi:hypothetical protein ACFV0D_24205 [Streptomyces sp. NPDC059556]|uniref:hypothetical protein n=1 Tax=Streptomyces sp. NPDC059556 TaxID=3346863 RepID=UPI0036C4F4AB
MFRFLGTARLVVVGGAISCRALSNWTTPPMFIGTPLVGPLLQVFFFVCPGRELGVADDRFHLVGNAVLAASASCVYGGTMAVADERRYGTLGTAGACSAFGLAPGALGLRFREVFLVSNVASSVLLLLTGAAVSRRRCRGGCGPPASCCRSARGGRGARADRRATLDTM